MSNTTHHTQDPQRNDIPNVRPSSTSNATDRLSLLLGQREMSEVPDAAGNANLTLRGQPTSAQTTRSRLKPTQMMQGHTDIVRASAFFKDGRRVVTGSNDETLRIWDVEKGELVGGPFKGHKGSVLSVAVSPDDRRIASGGKDRTIIIWDVESKQMVLGPLVKQRGAVWSVCFSPDGKRLASGSRDQTVVVWDAETGVVLATLQGHRDWVSSVAFSPDGLKLASGSFGTIQVWRTDNAELLLEINAHQHLVRSVVWSPDGQQLVSASRDKTINFWNSSNGDQIGQPCTGHTEYIISLAISSDGSFIATASDDKTVRLWSTETHQHIGEPLDHTNLVFCVTISPNGELLDIVEQWKAEKRIKDYEEVQRRLLLTLGDIQPRSHDTNDELSGKPDTASDHSSQSHQGSGCDENHSLFDIPTNTTVRNACITGDLHIAEELLTQEINADGNNHGSYAIRSVARARNSEWDKALHDSFTSIAIQPSLFGYISKGIALCGSERLVDAMEAFDLACIYSDRHPITVDLLLLIKAVALFNANYHDEARRRVQGLVTAYQHSDTLSCRVVNKWLSKTGGTVKRADRLNECIPCVTDFFSCGALFEPRLKIFTVLFGWDLDSLWQTVNQRRCEVFLRADRLIEAVQSHQYMMRIIEEDAKDSDLKWSTAFKQNCAARYAEKGDNATAESDFERAIELYSAGIELDPSCQSLFARRSKANLERQLYVEALYDAERVIALNPTSYLGYELKDPALPGVHCYDDAIEAFKTLLSKMDDASDTRIQKLCQQYVNPAEVEDAIRRAIHAPLENAPLRLINTSTGHLCDREAQKNAFMNSIEYKELLYSSMTHAPLQMKPIEEAVAKYFSWVMLSHRWESEEPLLHDIQGKVVYDLEAVGTMVKLQTFCKLARDAGHHWAWSDTCCIDQKSNVELQESVNSMFVWYRHSALTIVYLADAPPLTKSGALASSVWNTRGWTVQEFLAPNIVLFYRADWTPYLDDHSSNHKGSVAIMQELQDSTGIDAQALVAFRPGMTGAREKLQWASNRVTTLQEDIAYSLFGIFGIHLPVIYGEKRQNALGRLLQEIVAQSGDITALDWVGKSSEFNSCLPASISSYKSPPCTSPFLSEDQIQMSVLSLQNVTAVDLDLALYTRLANLSPPRFANCRLQLPCIAFLVTGVSRRGGQGQETCFTYDVKADGLDDLLITTEEKLIQFWPARPTARTFLLIRPWHHHDLGLPDFADEMQSMYESGPALDESLGSSPQAGDNEPANSMSRSRASKLIGGLGQPFGARLPAQQHGGTYTDLESHSRALRLIVRLGQPFGALLLAQQHGGEYKRIASDNNIIARVRDMAAVRDMMDVRTVEIL
ncbi:hypothetical protein DFH29DRAFT_1081516 [Suillus ampliporus]|nr:hypothetical protein DFH29DRAFT_1081516 [Suillus ampliporus]